jgi:hypothetical protein
MTAETGFRASKRSIYAASRMTVPATKDRTVHPELQRFVANRMGATTREVDRQPRPHAL